MKLLSQFFFGCVLCFSVAQINAAPYLYTFEGSIEYIEVDGQYLSDVDFDGDYATDTDTFRAGDIVEYVFLVDFDLPGYCNGPVDTSYASTCTGVNIEDSNTNDYFFAALHSANKLGPEMEEGTEFNYGINNQNAGRLVGDSAIFVISPFNESVNQWRARTDIESGTLVTGTDAWAGAFGNSPYGRINSSMELISIEPYAVEPKKEKRLKKCFKKWAKVKHRVKKRLKNRKHFKNRKRHAEHKGHRKQGKKRGYKWKHARH